MTGVGIELIAAPNLGTKPPMMMANAPANQKSCVA